ncbi:hypothetical protein bmyco0002_15710 [Bacillus pseudomycoides]|nr:hypothetical protein bmyco0002_15710 [Bacillus pseudomycoides]
MDVKFTHLLFANPTHHITNMIVDKPSTKTFYPRRASSSTKLLKEDIPLTIL